MEKEKGINDLSIVAFILSFLLFPVGLILSIIGLVKCKKYRRENGVNPKYYAFDIIGLIVSILGFIITLLIVGIVILVFGVLAYNEKYVVGSYTCNYPNSYRPAVTAEFKNGNFKWAKYGDEKNNAIYGTYRLNSVVTNNGDYEYKLIIKPTTINTNARINYKKSYDVVIKKISGKTTITFDNGTTYNCTKGNIGNEF